MTHRVLPWMKRISAVGGTAVVAVALFPHFEDAYWRRRDPHRVLGDVDSFTTSNSLVTATTTNNNNNNNNDDDNNHKKEKKNLVILGTGWASVSVLKHIDRDRYNVTVVSPRNYFLFTPLLPSVCAGTVTPGAVTVPVRDITSYKALSIWDRVRFMRRGYLPDRVAYLYAAVSDVDPYARTITCRHGMTDDGIDAAEKSSSFDLSYDVLVIGTGATTNTFNTEGVKEHCHYLKETGDATLLRQNVIRNLEKASLPTTTDDEKRRLLSFWVVGGGPTAVEIAAELQDFLHFDIVNPVHATFNQCAGYTSVNLVQSNKDCTCSSRQRKSFVPLFLTFCTVSFILSHHGSAPGVSQENSRFRVGTDEEIQCTGRHRGQGDQGQPRPYFCVRQGDEIDPRFPVRVGRLGHRRGTRSVDPAPHVQIAPTEELSVTENGFAVSGTWCTTRHVRDR